MLSFLGFGIEKKQESIKINYEEKLDPISRLRMVCFSFLIGENSNPHMDFYDRLDAEYNQKCLPELKEHLIFKDENEYTKNYLLDFFVNQALEYNFEKVLRLIVELKQKYNLKLLPHKILILAVTHPLRPQYNKENPKVFKTCLLNIIDDVKDIDEQFHQWKIINPHNKTTTPPSCLKRIWKQKLENMSGKLLQEDKKLVPDLVRVCHPRGTKNHDLDNIIKFGSTELFLSDKNWQSLRSLNWSWVDIMINIDWKMNHLDALDNFISFVKETQDNTLIAKYGLMIIEGVKRNKEQPIRYYSVFNKINKRNKEFREEDLEHMFNIIYICFDESLKNFPEIEGDTMILCDNSISSDYPLKCEYGEFSSNEISNFMGILTAYRCSGKGTVGLFGDNLEFYQVDKERCFFEQFNEILLLKENIIKSTEDGLLKFFINHNTKYDNIFIYSDMQAAYGYLYGLNPDDYKDYQIIKGSCKYLDVLKLVENYRQKINNKTNFYSIKVEHYSNNINPRNIYRGSIFNGWSGKEILYIKQMNKFWNDIENDS